MLDGSSGHQIPIHIVIARIKINNNIISLSVIHGGPRQTFLVLACNSQIFNTSNFTTYIV